MVVSNMPPNSTYDDLDRRNTMLNRLLDVSLVLNANLSLKPVLTYIMESVCEITAAEAASILLYNRNNDELRFAASNTPDSDQEALLKLTVPMNGSIAGQIARENQPIVINNADEDPRIYRPVDESIGFRTRSLLGVPMHIRGNVIGVLEALNKNEGRWSDDDLQALTILASHAAVAIQNARQTEQLRKAYNELDKLDKIKNDFIAVASHELRTPLGVILGYASFLAEEAQGDVSEHATAVLNSAMHLRSLIEDMTNMRYLHLGKIQLQREHTSIHALITAAQSDLQSLAEAKGQNLVVQSDNLNMMIFIDKAKMIMALLNILNNAIKFTPNRGLITFTTELRGQELWLRITDTGSGIPDTLFEKVFEEFYQVDDHMTRRHNGMGLGLAIARGMVEAHSGRVFVERSELKQGTTMAIVLPLVAPAE
jgi:signal transduction histidine kinase